MKKKLVAMCMLFALGMTTVMSGCGKEQEKNAEEQKKENPLVTGVYKAEEADLLNSFVRFNEDGTYYAKYFDGGILEAGTYELLDEEMEYFTSPGADEDYATEEDNEKAVASQVVVLTTYQGNVQKVAYAEDALKDMTLGGFAGHRNLPHNADYEYDPAVDELPVAIVSLCADDDAGASLTLYHDKTFVDYTGETGEEGTWEKNEDGTYSLTSEDAVYTLEVADDGNSAEYNKADETMKLENLE